MTIDTFLKTWVKLIGKVPNVAQQSVFEHSNGPLWVIAGPGTGKTQTLILRCLFLLCVKQVPPEAIILTTFTRKAADELETRLQESSKPDKRNLRTPS